MTVITRENAPVIQSLLNDVSRDKPRVGLIARVVSSRKHQGKVGRIEKHMLSRYGDPFRYGNEMSHIMMQARGRHGYVVLIKNETESFWVPAENIMVCVER